QRSTSIILLLEGPCRELSLSDMRKLEWMPLGGCARWSTHGPGRVPGRQFLRDTHGLAPPGRVETAFRPWPSGRLRAALPDPVPTGPGHHGKDAMTSLAASPQSRSVPTLVAVAVPCGCLVWAFWTTLLELAQVWHTNPQYSHGYLVPGFALL